MEVIGFSTKEDDETDARIGNVQILLSPLGSPLGQDREGDGCLLAGDQDKRGEVQVW